jgi:hypothetical protein
MRRPLLVATACATAGLTLFFMRTAETAGQTSALVRLQPTTPGTAQTGHVNVSGSVLAGSLAGNGAGVTALNATNITSGTLADARYSSNVPLKNANNVFTGTNQFNSDFTGINRNAPLTQYESFGIGNNASFFDGMFVKTGLSGYPFYGYQAGTGSGQAYHYFSAAEMVWRLVIGTGTPLTVATTKVGINASSLSDTLTVGGSVVASHTGIAVLGYSNGNDAVVGQTYAAGKSGVYGYTNVAGANGGYFNSAAVSGVGIGVVGQCNSATGFAMYAYGRTGASGTKSFRIDHPLDPANKYLLHYSAEGPEPLNVYSGTTHTDANGSAWVDLPDYFSEINKDPRVQLTVRDDSADFVMSKVVGEVTGKGFEIRTSKPGVTVFWEVKAVRNDAFVRTYGAPVEVEKPEREKGRYQHPELYGAPESQGITNLYQSDRIKARFEDMSAKKR